MQLSPDSSILFQFGFLTINATILFTWLVMGLLVLGSWLVTRNLSTGPVLSRRQNFLESIISFILGQIGDVTRQKPVRFLPFLGTIFIFVAAYNSFGNFAS